jgi:ubiquinone/menaquinone biosynthesis C-methylase UbiE
VIVIPHDNLEEFQDPDNYDLEEIPRSLPRIDFYVQLARRTGGPVLELACGSGIVALPVARTGLHVTGVDVAEPMLQHAQGKAVAQGLESMTRWVQGDATQVRLDREPPFKAVFITGNAFQAFLTAADQQALLATVKRHLHPAGVFAFETRNPSGTDLTDRTDEEHWAAFISAQGHAVTVTGLQRFDHEQQLMHWTTFHRWHDGETPRETTTRITCKFTPPAELDAQLRHSGFDVTERYGDWDGSPFTARSEHIISICRLL